MLGRRKNQELTDEILGRSEADQTEVVVIARDSALTRFANSAIHQNVAEKNPEVRIRVVVRDPGTRTGGRIGMASTNSLEEEALVRTLEKAVAMARLQPLNPDFVSLPEPLPLTAVDAFSESTAGCTPERRARGAGIICTMARDKGASAFGALTTTVQELAVASSLGTFAYHHETSADINTVVMTDTGAGYASALSQDLDRLDFEALGREAVDKCLRSQNPRALGPGDYTVILEPYAVQDLVQMFGFTGFSAVAVDEGRSFMSGRLDEQVVDPRVSIWDDGHDPAGIPLPFDFEGVPKSRVEMIRNGAAGRPVYSSYQAHKEGRASTGHALPLPSYIDALALNAFFGPGDSSIEEMIAGTERGVYITRFHYTRPVEPVRVVITGMTRDGTFLVERGEIAQPVKNLRFTQSYIEALNRVEAIGRDTKLLSGVFGVARDSVPALKLGGFSFTGATEF
jgi:predicted Zn-dependent protease